MGPFILDRLRFAGLRERVGKILPGQGRTHASLEDVEVQAPGRFFSPNDSSEAAENPHKNNASHASWGRPLNAVKGVFGRGRRNTDSAELEEDYRPAPINGHDGSELLEDLSLEQAIGLLQDEMEWSDPPQEDEGKEIRSRLPDMVNKLIDRAKDYLGRRTTTLTVEKGVARIVVFEGNEVVAWGLANPDSDMRRLLGIGAQDENYPSRLRGLLEEIQLRRARIVTDLPLYTPLLRRFQLPKFRRKYLDPVIVSEVLDTIPFDEKEVDVAWQYRPNDSGNEVFATAVPKTVVDNHIEVLRGLNVQPSAAYSRGTALAHAIGVPNAIVVHLAPEHSAVVLVREHAPQIIQELGLPEEAAGVERRIEVISQAVEQVGSYYQPLIGKSEEPVPPVIVTGEFSSESGLLAKLRVALSNEVISFVATDIVYPEHFPPQEYAVNIGLALGDRARTKLRNKIKQGRGPTVNLLSHRHLPRPWPVWPVASFVTILMLAVLAINFSPLVGNLEVEAATLSTRLDNLKRQERTHRIEQGRARATQERIQSFELLTDSLLGQLDLLEEDLDVLLLRAEQITRKALFPAVSVNSLSLQGEEFSLTGSARTYEDVLQYTSNLREAGVFDDVRIIRIARPNTMDADVAFQIKIKAEPVLKDEETGKDASRRR